MQVILYEPDDAARASLASSFFSNGMECYPASREEIEGLVPVGRADRSPGGSPAIILGVCPEARGLVATLRSGRCDSPIIALQDGRSTERTLDLLMAGCDDVVQRPVSPRELAARIAAIQRRAFGHAAASVTVGGMTIYFDGREPEIAGRPIRLSGRENAIFRHLALQSGKVVSKGSLYDAVYGASNRMPFDKVIEVHICKLRKKLVAASGGHDFIETVYGRGYKLVAPKALAAA